MLVKLAIANVRKSARDFAVYFFTLVLGVAVFYAFNSIADSSAVANLGSDTREVVQLLGNIIAGVSVFIVIILGFLVLYANAFLIRRRRAEFGMYLTLGMGKGDLLKISACETLIVGVASLVVGLLVGIGLSQVLSNVAAGMLSETVEGVAFSFSPTAFVMTVAAFAAIFAVSVVWNSVHLAKSKLIDLLAGSRKNDTPKLRRVWLSFVLFLVALGIIGYSYSMLLRTGLLSDNNLDLLVETLLVSAGTVLLFFSLSGFMLKVTQLIKPLYYRGLNMVFLRQLASRMNSTFVSMSVIAMTLFLALTSVCGGIGIVDAMQKNAEAGVRCDASVTSYYDLSGIYGDDASDVPVSGIVESTDYDTAAGMAQQTLAYGAPEWQAMVKNSAQLNFYVSDIGFAALRDATGLDVLDSVGAGVFSGASTDAQRALLVPVSGFNAARQLCGLESVTLGEGECLLWSDFATTQGYLRKVAEAQPTLTINGADLRVQPSLATDTIECTSNGTRAFEIVVPDSVVSGAPTMSILDVSLAEGAQSDFDSFCMALNGDLGGEAWPVWMYQTADGVRSQGHAMTALVSYLAIYIGFIMVVASAAILAIQQLSDANDSVRRYELLAKLGAPSSMISGALFKQVLVSFALPLIVAVAHTLCAMQVVKDIVLVFGFFDIGATAAITTAVFLLVYGLYFLATYLGARAMVMPKKA